MLKEKKYQYRDITTNEIVEDFMAEEYVLRRLGITIEPMRQIWRNDIRTIRKYTTNGRLVF